MRRSFVFDLMESHFAEDQTGGELAIYALAAGIPDTNHFVSWKASQCRYRNHFNDPKQDESTNINCIVNVVFIHPFKYGLARFEA
jgi:hypothetical protein